MFKSTVEYDKAIYNVLTFIRDDKSLSDFSGLSEEDFGDVVNTCNSKNYIDGISIEKNILGQYLIDGSPRITYSGLQFIENFNQ